MATVRELQTKARKALAKWKKDYSKALDSDNSSPVSHLCLTILMRNNNITNATKACNILRERFVDWNEIRVSPIAEVRDALEEVQCPNAEQKAYALRRFLRDVFGKFTKTNLYFDKMNVPEVVPELLPGEKPETTDDDDDDADDAVTRESGLPDHPTVPGYVDMRKIIDQVVPLDPKLITEKNSTGVASVVWDDAERGPFSTLWRVCIAEGLLEPEYEGTEALQRLRQIAPEKERDEFAYYAVIHAENNWPKISKVADKSRKKAVKAKA
ncbi:MAG: hypothetical protein K8I27_09765 [Planctomycetes bacterium]|nr:hypothetical protein [Planctomycetota bacterium]